MANKIMKTLTMGGNTYEIVDAAARNDIETMKTEIVSIDKGGTGASDAPSALDNLGAAAKSRAAALTVLASAWTGEGPYSASVNCDIAAASNNLVVGAGGGITADQMVAMMEAMIVCTAQADGSITLTAYGTLPEIDLPFNVLEVG